MILIISANIISTTTNNFATNYAISVLVYKKDVKYDIIKYEN